MSEQQKWCPACKQMADNSRGWLVVCWPCCDKLTTEEFEAFVKKRPFNDAADDCTECAALRSQVETLTRELDEALNSMAQAQDRHAAALLENADLAHQLKEARALLKACYVLLEGLRLGVEWELAPPIMVEIARLAGGLEAALSASRQGAGEATQCCVQHGDPLICLACEAEEDARPEWQKPHRVTPPLLRGEHRCSGCGHSWRDGPAAAGEWTGAELCGDCWRRAQRTVHGEAQAPQEGAGEAEREEK